MITLITGNPKKAEQIQAYVPTPLTHQAIDLPEIQSDDVETIAKDKAERAFAIVGTTIIVEDTALTFHALGNLPGPYIKWFLENLGSDGLCKLLADFPDRRATATTCVVYQDEAGQHCFTGTATGTIAKIPSGTTDFGWNNIFIPDGQTLTWAEMAEQNMKRDTMRTEALDQLAAFLKSQ
jgi:inosine triphosphate pyrophosphatase